jgi:hypothetical protein
MEFVPSQDCGDVSAHQAVCQEQRACDAFSNTPILLVSRLYGRKSTELMRIGFQNWAAHITELSFFLEPPSSLIKIRDSCFMSCRITVNSNLNIAKSLGPELLRAPL